MQSGVSFAYSKFLYIPSFDWLLFTLSFKIHVLRNTGLRTVEWGWTFMFRSSYPILQHANRFFISIVLDWSLINLTILTLRNIGLRVACFPHLPPVPVLLHLDGTPVCGLGNGGWGFMFGSSYPVSSTQSGFSIVVKDSINSTFLRVWEWGLRLSFCLVQSGFSVAEMRFLMGRDHSGWIRRIL